MKQNDLQTNQESIASVEVAGWAHRQLEKSGINSIYHAIFTKTSNPVAFGKLALVVLSITIMSAFSNEALAQCSYVLTDTNNVTTTTVIPCDFPVLMDTGNPATDLATYNAAKTTWLSVNPGMDMVLDVPNTSKTFHIDISNSTFQGFGQGKQTAILADPYYYHVIP
jgi:hypothetical protein